MNQLFLHLATNNKEGITHFVKWYSPLYSDTPIQVFSKLPFEHQLGVFLKYFEEVYGFAVIADNTGYIIYYVNKDTITYNITERFRANVFYHIYKEVDYPETTVVIQYGKAIIYLFNNLDLPF